jgi:hypothetical protein
MKKFNVIEGVDAFLYPAAKHGHLKKLAGFTYLIDNTVLPFS